MTDILNMDKINSLQHPLIAIEHDEKWNWPIYDICVETALVRIDVCGLLERKELLDFKFIQDFSGERHDVCDFFLDEGE